MEGFREGYDFFQSHAGNFVGVSEGVRYVDSVETEITKLVKNLNQFSSNKAGVATLKGDVAEFWHAGTFNINAVVKGSNHRVEVERSHELGSVDIRGKNFESKFGLKYYKNGAESAKQQAKSIFEKFQEYKSNGGKESLENYLQKRGYSADKVLSDPLYAGQYRVIPSDQFKAATEWLERRIKEESVKRPEEVRRYQETLDMLRSKVSDNKGNESIELTETEARKLAQLSKEGDVTAEELNLTTEELIRFKDILRQSCKAGMSAAVITMVLKTSPEILKAIHYLIENGEIDEEQFKVLGFKALTSSSEGFIRGTVSAAITGSCKAGLCGSALKSLDPSVIGATTVLVMNSMKNSYKVAIGEMSRTQMVNELIKEMFVSTCALSMGAAGQSFIQIPLLGYMMGSFVGSLAGSIFYDAAYSPVISFCVDSGFTMFGLVEQNYELPEEVLKEIGIEVFEYEKFDYSSVETETFQFATFTPERVEEKRIDMVFLRRGVIGINCIGFI